MPKLPTWDDVKKVASDVEKKVQDAGTATKQKWQTTVKPKFVEVGKKIEEKGQQAGDAIQDQLIKVNDALIKLQQNIAEDLKRGRTPKPGESAPEPPPPKTDEP